MESLNDRIWNILSFCLSISNYEYCKIKREYNTNIPIIPFLYNRLGYSKTYYVLSRLNSPDLYRQILSEKQFIISEEKSYVYWDMLISLCRGHLGIGEIIEFASHCKYKNLCFFINQELISLIETNHCYMVLYFMKYYNYYLDLANSMDLIINTFTHDNQIMNLLCDPFFKLNVEEIKAKILLKKLC